MGTIIEEVEGNTREDNYRAKVRLDADGVLVITTISGGVFRSVFYSGHEIDDLLHAIMVARENPQTRQTVPWDEASRGPAS